MQGTANFTFHVPIMNTGPGTTVRFSNHDLTLFSTASHDRNPLHLSAEYTRRTSFGQPVVFGVLGALACLSKIQPASDSRLSGMSLEFQNPMFLDIDYEVVITQQSPSASSVSLYDGSKVLVAADFTFAGSDGAVSAEALQASRPATSDRNKKALTDQIIARGEYSPDQSAMSELLRRFAIDEQRFGRMQLAALLWSSYLVGMEQPGRRALFHKLNLSFDNLKECCTPGFSYEAEVISTRTYMVRSELRLLSGEQLLGKGQSLAFLNPESPVSSIGTVSNLLAPSDDLKGKVALVVGASRGLGAMLTAALASQGCSVFANFNRSESEAVRLKESLAGSSGEVFLVKGDAADLVWCEQLRDRISQEFGCLNFLFCNASPSILPLQLEPKMVGRINSYVSDALALVSVPLSVFLKSIEERSGWSVVISSVAVDTAPKEWPHYVAVKSAIEGLVRVAARQYAEANFLLVRPPRLKTDLTNTPFGRGASMPPELAATKIVQRLKAPPLERIEVLCLREEEVTSETNRIDSSLKSFSGSKK
jgi:NAD(P)-dependent dehydrogenase (short-subunit alcohol dehydrogenase family)/acyl dehydratase